MPDTGFEHLLRSAQTLLELNGRKILGIAGPPGVGKSTLASRLQSALGEAAAVVPMDGFHLANEELERLGHTDRKGAPEAFDGAGYVALLRRLRKNDGRATIYAPTFDRNLDQSIAGAIPIGPEIRLIITEGNYLLLADQPWSALREIINDIWLIELLEAQRHAQLLRRHMAFGRSMEQALGWIAGNDENNAKLIESRSFQPDHRLRL